MNKKNNRIGTGIVIATIIVGMCISIAGIARTRIDADAQEMADTQASADTANRRYDDQMVSHKEIYDNTQYGSYELPLVISQRVEIYQIQTETDFNILLDALEVRNGKIIIQISNGTVLNGIGDGLDNLGYYRDYDSSKFLPGDKVQSVFVYNPGTNAVDDIQYRVDTLIQ